MSTFLRSLGEASETFRALAALEPEVGRAADLLRSTLLGGHKLLVCGNGGSAADGADFSAEFTCRFSGGRGPFPAINLSAGGSLLTAIANDYEYSEVFARQVRALAQPGDLLVAISTSGRSPSILRALEQARASGIGSIALLGRGGGPAKGIATIELVVPSDTTARIQEAHKFLLHVLCESVDPALREARPA